MKQHKKPLAMIPAFALTLTMIISTITVSADDTEISGGSTTLILGDSDLSGFVTILDATCIQRHLAGYEQLTGDAKKTADADRDSNISILDATVVQQYLAGFETAATIGEPIGNEDPTRPPVTGDEWKDNTGTITLADSGITATGDGAYVDGNVVIITEGGDWTVTGSYTNGMIYVDAGDDKDVNDKVNLRLNGMSLSCANGPAIYFERCKKAFITLEEGTQNTVSDGSYRKKGAETHTAGGTQYSIYATAAKGALHADDNLEIKGKGALTINGNYKHGISVNNGVTVESGVLNINSATDAIHASGGITLNGSGVEVNINSNGDAFDCEDTVSCNRVRSLNITAVGKGIKATGNILLSSGSYTINTTDDCINGNAQVTIDNGSYLLTSGDDAVHADTTLTVNGGTVTIPRCYEGMEANQVVINGGVIDITSANDGINAASTDGSAMPNIVTVNGGEVYMVASGDGIDANGTIDFYGGLTVVQGPPESGNFAIDADDAVGFYGGTVVATCTSNAKWTDITGKQINGVYNMNIGHVDKDSVICITDCSGSVLSAVKSQLSGNLGLVYYRSNTPLSSVRFVTGGLYNGALNSHGYGTGGTVSGGTSCSP